MKEAKIIILIKILYLNNKLKFNKFKFIYIKNYKEFIHGQHKCLDLYDVATAAISIKFCETKKVNIEDLSNLRSTNHP